VRIYRAIVPTDFTIGVRMKRIAGSARSPILKRLLLSCPLLALLLWLIFSTSPSKRRERELNVLIEKGELGKVDPALSKRLRLQFPWLALHAGVRQPVAINAPIDRNRLTLIVTTPRYEKVTQCGPGNALFDPSLNVIFIDQSLLWPTEVNIIGTPSVNSMFTIDDYGYIVSYSNFILAHELGHWQKHRRAAAFFYYGWGDGMASLAEEEAADSSAVATIFAARAAGDEPAELRKLDALAAIGLKPAELTTREQAAGDVLGGMILMTNDLLFSSSPFSPHYANRTHPDMLARADAAIRNVEVTPPGAVLKAETSLVQAELTRFAALGHWRHREIFLPGPLTTAEVRAGFLWLGRTDIPSIGTVKLEEQVERIPLDALTADDETATTPITPTLVKTGYSKVGEEYGFAEYFGSWVEHKFENGDPQIGLPPSRTSTDALPDHGWPDRDDHSLKLKINLWATPSYAETVWQWPRHNTTSAGNVTERFLADNLQRLLSGRALSMGRLQWSGDTLVFAVVAQTSKGQTEIRLFELSNSAPVRLTERPEFRFSSSGIIDVSGATVWDGSLWVPVRIGEGEPGFRAELWRISPSGPKLFGTLPFLAGQSGTSLDTKDVTRLVPLSPKFQSISGGRAVFGYDHDSLSLVDEQLGKLRLLFHPASSGLQLTDLGGGHIVFWNLHARKAYIIHTDRGEK
jgi:hypothetical protein